MTTRNRLRMLVGSMGLAPRLAGVWRAYPDTDLVQFVLGVGGRRAVLDAFEAIAATVDRPRIEALKTRFGGVRGAGSNKYLDLPVHITRAIGNVRLLGLDRGPPIAVLDLGTGAGWFPTACRHFGNDCAALDLDVDPLYREMMALLGVRRTVWRIEPRQKLPAFDRRFDCITAFQILFDRLPDGSLWTESDWGFFLDELAANVAAPGGRFVMGLNTVYSGQHEQHRRNLEFLRGRGAVALGPCLSLRLS